MELGDISDLIVDCEHKTAPTQDAGYPSIRTPNIGRGRFILDNVNRVSEDTYRQWTRRAIPKPGDLIMAREAPVGNVAMIPHGLEPCLGQRTLLIRCDRNKAEPAYVSYLLNGPQVQGTIYGMTNGATVAHLNMADVRTLPIPAIPPLPTQRKIAAVLSAYDDLIENNERRIRILEEMAQNLYREWFVKFRFPGHKQVKMVDSPLGKIPQGWTAGKLADVVVNLRNGTSAGEHLQDRKYVPIDCISKKTLTLSQCEPWENAQSSLILFEKSDILFGAMRPYFHKVAVAPWAGVTRTTCLVLRPRDVTWTGYAAYLLFQEETVAYATAHSKGATIPYNALPWGGNGGVRCLSDMTRSAC